MAINSSSITTDKHLRMLVTKNLILEGLKWVLCNNSQLVQNHNVQICNSISGNEIPGMRSLNPHNFTGLDGYEEYELYYADYHCFDDSEILFEEDKHPTCILGSDGNMTFEGELEALKFLVSYRSRILNYCSVLHGFSTHLRISLPKDILPPPSF